MVTCLILGQEHDAEPMAMILRQYGLEGWTFITIPDPRNKVDVVLQLGNDDPVCDVPVIHWGLKDLMQHLQDAISDSRIKEKDSEPTPSRNIYPYIILFLAFIVLLGRIASC